MKATITYLVEKTKTIIVPKEYEFFFKKSEYDFTNKELNKMEKFNEVFIKLLGEKYVEDSFVVEDYK